MTSDALPSTVDLYRPLKRSTFELSTTAWLPQPVDDVFPFFGDAHNLNLLTPPVAALRDPHADGRSRCTPGTLIDYRITLRGLPMRWRTRISLWEPNRRFVDEQVRGPVSASGSTPTRSSPVDGGTLMKDAVRYRVPGGVLVNRVCSSSATWRASSGYRLEALRRHFGCAPSPRDRRRDRARRLR